MTTVFQNGCITHLLRGLLSTALYCKREKIESKNDNIGMDEVMYLVVVEPIEVFLSKVVLVQETHFGFRLQS